MLQFRLQEVQLNSTFNMLQFRLEEVPFIGHVLTPEGLIPTKEDQGVPRNAYPSFQRLLGMVTYLFNFVPKLSDHNELLRTLTGKPEVPNGGGCPNMKGPASSSSVCKLLPQFCATMMLAYQLLFSVTRLILI